MNKVKRRWSITMMLSMMCEAKYICKRAMLNEISGGEFNLVGDWLYYRIHADEQDPIKNRPVPQSIGAIFRKLEQRSWMENVKPSTSEGNLFGE